jgi:hypothetical protein
MDCINLNEAPGLGLARQHKRRCHWLLAIFITWLLWSGGIYLGLNYLAKNQAQKSENLLSLNRAMQSDFLERQGLIKQWERQRNAACAARFLTELMRLPVKGVNITALSFEDDWTLEGKSVNEQALFEFKIKIENQLSQCVWEHHDNEFKVSGSMIC